MKKQDMEYSSESEQFVRRAGVIKFLLKTGGAAGVVLGVLLFVHFVFMPEKSAEFMNKQPTLTPGAIFTATGLWGLVFAHYYDTMVYWVYLPRRYEEEPRVYGVYDEAQKMCKLFAVVGGAGLFLVLMLFFKADMLPDAAAMGAGCFFVFQFYWGAITLVDNFMRYKDFIHYQDHKELIKRVEKIQGK